MRYTTVVSEADGSVWSIRLVGASGAVDYEASIPDVRKIVRVEGEEPPLTDRVCHRGASPWTGHRTEWAEWDDDAGLLSAQCSCSVLLCIFPVVGDAEALQVWLRIMQSRLNTLSIWARRTP